MCRHIWKNFFIQMMHLKFHIKGVSNLILQHFHKHYYTNTLSYSFTNTHYIISIIDNRFTIQNKNWLLISILRKSISCMMSYIRNKNLFNPLYFIFLMSHCTTEDSLTRSKICQWVIQNGKVLKSDNLAKEGMLHVSI